MQSFYPCKNWEFNDYDYSNNMHICRIMKPANMAKMMLQALSTYNTEDL